MGSEILTKPMRSLSTALSCCPRSLQLQPRSGWAGQPCGMEEPHYLSLRVRCGAGQRCNLTGSTSSWRHPLQPLSSHQLITSPGLWRPAKACCTGPSRAGLGLGRRETPKDCKIFEMRKAKGLPNPLASRPFQMRKLRPERGVGSIKGLVRF